MTERTAARLAWAVFAFAVAGLVATAVLAVLDEGAGGHSGSEVIQDVLFSVALLSFSIVGVLIARRQPHNPIGWILLAVGVCWEVAIFADLYGDYGFNTNPGALWRPELVLAVTSTAWVPAVGLMGTFLLLLFPDGRLQSRRWRPLAWISAIVLFLLTVSVPFIPGSLQDFSGDTSLPDLANPLGIEALRSLSSLPDMLVVPLLVCMLACALGVIRRFRRARGQERLQMKWLAAGGGLSAALYLVFMAFGAARQWAEWTPPAWVNVFEDLIFFAFVLIPVSIGIAILKHRLYDIDVVINKTLVFGSLTAVLAGVYFAGVVGVGGALRALTGQANNGPAVAASTLAVAALFRPARARIQGFIDRRFYRARYDAAHTLESFTSRLRDEVDLDELGGHLLAAITETMHPAHASLWLVPEAER